MKKYIIATIALSFLNLLNAQEYNNMSETNESQDKKSYYEQRAKEDATFEQKFKAKSETEESEFWQNQKEYEKELKKRDRKAYRAYMQGKKDAYAEHYNHCDTHCHHSQSYYYHVSYYHHGYHRYYYERYPSRNSISARIGVSTPRVRLGIL
jgi:hypothetical protein